MDYYEIGQRIRKYRRAKGLSQEELADQVSISVTHMSHIETGNTKLSLAVLVSLAQALETQTDELLFPAVQPKRGKAMDEILQIMEGCSTEHLPILRDVMQSTIIALKKYL